MRKTNHIDTDDLSEPVYQAIMIEAEKFNHDLTLRFGVLSYHCENEKEYIENAKTLIEEILKFNLAEIDDMFFGNPPPKKEFHAALKRIKQNIEELK